MSLRSRPAFDALRAAALALALAAVGCGDKPSAKAPAADAPWTADRIAADPTGFLDHAIADTAKQIAARRERIAKIGEHRAEIKSRAEKSESSADTLASLRKRLAAAIARADENDSWPITFATLTLERNRAAAILAGAEREASKESELSGEYADAFAKLAAAETACRNDIRNLEILGEKLALRRRQAELNRDAADIAEMGRSAETLTSLAEALNDTSAAINLDTLPPPAESAASREPDLAPFL